MFRLLSLHPAPDITTRAAASLAGLDETAGRRALRELSRAQMLAEHVPGRYACHDLLRAYAADQARAHDSQPERTAAIRRLLDHYLHTAARGAFLLRPAHEPIELAAPAPGVTPERLADTQQALAWFKAERHIIAAAVTLAVQSGFGVHARELPRAMIFLSRQSSQLSAGPPDVPRAGEPRSGKKTLLTERSLCSLSPGQHRMIYGWAGRLRGDGQPRGPSPDRPRVVLLAQAGGGGSGSGSA
jgi:hypothetical protein